MLTFAWPMWWTFCKLCQPSIALQASSQQQWVLSKACKKAAWEEWCHPKFHWILHMGKHLSKWSMLPSTWVRERKHKIAKQYASLQRNTTGYDRSILLECLGHCQSELQQPNVFATATRLDQQGSASAKLRNFLADYMNEPVQSLATSHYAHLALGGSCRKGDVVLLKHARQVGENYSMQSSMASCCH